MVRLRLIRNSGKAEKRRRECSRLAGRLLSVTLAVFLVAACLAAGIYSSFGQPKGYVPDFARETSSTDAYLAAPLTVCENSGWLFERLREANRAWLDRDAHWPEMQVEYETVFFYKAKPEEKECKKIAGAYDRGIDYWIPSSLLLYHEGEVEVYQGAKGATCGLYLEAEVRGSHYVFRLCHIPDRYPMAWLDTQRLRRRFFVSHFPVFSLESVFSPETGHLLNERFLFRRTNGGRVYGWETKFDYAGGDYPKVVTIRELSAKEEEQKHGYYIYTMEFEMINGAWMLRWADFSCKIPGWDPTKPTGWLIENENIEVTKLE
jgi:hypothetical protein